MYFLFNGDNFKRYFKDTEKKGKTLSASYCYGPSLTS